MNCIHFKQKLNHKFECKLTEQQTTLSDCRNCASADRKPIKEGNYTSSNKCLSKGLKTYSKLVAKTPMKKVSKKRARIEKNRFSLFTNDLSVSIESKLPKDDLHECISGKNRLNSIKWGLVVPLTRAEHENAQILLKWQLKGQKEFIKRYGYDKFMEIFKTDYIEKHKKKTTR